MTAWSFVWADIAKVHDKMLKSIHFEEDAVLPCFQPFPKASWMQEEQSF